MNKTWLFQANPKMYDIDAALAQLEEIAWRVPQHTSEIQPGDVAVLWRSGQEAGIVGVGRVLEHPYMQADDQAEEPFVLAPEVAGVDTRVRIRVKSTPLVSKDQIKSIEGLENHPIITAPMGTVFPLQVDLYERLRPLLAEPPAFDKPIEADPMYPAVFAWGQRSKSVHPMPGGYGAYLKSLRALLDAISEVGPAKKEFPALIVAMFDVTTKRAELLANFLRKVSFVIESGGAIGISDWGQRWLTTGDDNIAVALIHSRARFIGEMLAEALMPRMTLELLEIANEKYGCAWSTKAQIDRRRGWLESAGMLEADEANRLITTDRGKSLIDRLALHVPAVGATSAATEQAVQEAVSEEESPVPSQVSRLIDELEESSLDSSNSSRFEKAVRDAFDWLGFVATWIGGAGQTDVILDAPLGKDASYRVIVDCKSTGSGSLSDHQIDWMTLAEHRAKHDADYVAVVGPQPAGKRLFERAEQSGVVVLSVEDLITLCQQHASAPLGLDAYQSVFLSAGKAVTESVAEGAEDWLQAVDLATLVLETIEHRSGKFGTLRADQLALLLVDDPRTESVGDDDYRAILDGLAGPPFGILSGTAGDGYRLAVPPSVARYRLRVLQERLFPRSQPEVEGGLEAGDPN
jgi:hypothetical protein